MRPLTLLQNPLTTFSTNQVSAKDDYRNYLFESFVKVVDEFQPEVFVFENAFAIVNLG